MNATIDREKLLMALTFLGRVPGRSASLRLVAVDDKLQCVSGPAGMTIEAMVLEPGAFTTKRLKFTEMVRSFRELQTLTIQSDAERFRMGAFSAAVTNYDPAPPATD